MVIHTFCAPVFFNEGQVQIPAAHRCPAIFYDGHGPLIQRHRGQAGRRAQTFLTARIADIDVPGVDFYGGSSQRGDRVHQNQGIMFMDNPDDFLQRLQHAC